MFVCRKLATYRYRTRGRFEVRWSDVMLDKKYLVQYCLYRKKEFFSSLGWSAQSHQFGSVEITFWSTELVPASKHTTTFVGGQNRQNQTTSASVVINLSRINGAPHPHPTQQIVFSNSHPTLQLYNSTILISTLAMALHQPRFRHSKTINIHPNSSILVSKLALGLQSAFDTLKPAITTSTRFL